jgi:hypothetical protein
MYIQSHLNLHGVHKDISDFWCYETSRCKTVYFQRTSEIFRRSACSENLCLNAGGRRGKVTLQVRGWNPDHITANFVASRCSVCAVAANPTLAFLFPACGEICNLYTLASTRKDNKVPKTKTVTLL